MHESINEKVTVLTVYDRMAGTVAPKKIRWQGRDYYITNVAYYHKIKQGRVILHIFHVTTGNLDFRLKCDSETLYWTLEEVCDGLAS